MDSKLALALTAFCLIYVLEIEGTFIKVKNVPRVGRSNEADGPYGQDEMGYVIKTIPSKNIPRMGRRNYDSGNRFDIPKYYELPSENLLYGGEGQVEKFYETELENMKK